MRNIIIVGIMAFVLMSFTVKAEKKKTEVKGVIENIKKKNRLVLHQNSEIVASLSFNKKGDFNDNISVEEGYYKLTVQGDRNETITVYLLANDVLSLEADAKDFENSIRFVGGKSMKINNYLTKSRIANNNEIKKQGGVQKLFQQKENEFINFIETLKTNSLKLLKEADLPEWFNKIEQRRIAYNSYFLLANYPEYYKSLTKNFDYKTSQKYKAVIRKIDLQNKNDYQKLPIYKKLLMLMYWNKFSDEANDKKTVVKEIKALQLDGFSDEIAEGITDLIDANNIDEFSVYVTMLTKNKELLQELENRKKRFASLGKGKLSPSFSYKSYEGKSVSLKSLRGKVVYIDIWATWCGPCKAELPYLEKIEESYKNKDVVFVSISVDEAVKSWLKFVKKHQLKGVQLLADKNWNSDFIKAYAVNSIPRFILIDKKGAIVNANAPRPSSGKLPQLLDKVLAQ